MYIYTNNITKKENLAQKIPYAKAGPPKTL